LTRRLIAAALLSTALLAWPALPGAWAASELPEPLRFEVAGAGGPEAAAACRTAWRRRGADLLARLVPAGMPIDTVRVLLLSTEQFRRTFGTRIPDWGVGVALAGGRVVAVDYQELPAVGRGVEEVFLHEMVHALLMQSTAGIWLPTWLHEGTAMRLAGEWRFTDTVAVILSGRLPSLQRLRAPFPQGVAGANTAYRTSLLAVEKLHGWYGEDILPRLVAATRRNGDFPAAFTDVTGEALETFENRFASAMRVRYGWVVLVFRWPTLFVIMALVFAIGAAGRIVRSRRRLREMESEEA
jgi:hypothetical protein